ncbi:hypothetical protein [Streptomyces paromomycinus]|uniref:Uncharacterized protein n=1 Tax=Streptomyces paromomycinus TaxID=92743 RepID=A0A401W8S3_STREY|nr:hypothetical protein [Streptomyces paromomycinus]GCD45713.1 hypothetical protein GKJPGBOP_05451 [Streptomyces paromomycinus]
MFARKSSDNTEAVSRHKAAKAALRENQRAEKAAGVHEETDTFRELNAEAADAARGVSWWRRG